MRLKDHRNPRSLEELEKRRLCLNKSDEKHHLNITKENYFVKYVD